MALADARRFGLAVNSMRPGLSVDFMTTRQRPLQALRFLAWNGSTDSRKEDRCCCRARIVLERGIGLSGRLHTSARDGRPRCEERSEALEGMALSTLGGKARQILLKNNQDLAHWCAALLLALGFTPAYQRLLPPPPLLRLGSRDPRSAFGRA